MILYINCPAFMKIARSFILYFRAIAHCNGIIAMMFLDRKKPIATCESESCDDCAIQSSVHCHFNLKDLLYFLFISLPSFIIGAVGIYYMDVWLLIPWIIIIIAFFMFIEIRVMCSHCPHYAESPKTLKCRANYGSPKLWKYRPGPMTNIEKTFFFAGFAIVWGYPLPIMILTEQMLLLLLYLLVTIGFFIILTVFMCSQCVNFACPLNHVDKKVRNQFLDKNPEDREAWRKYRHDE